MTAGSSYTVRLHFAEFYWTKAGQRVFNAAINGAPVLTNFDIVKAAGATNQAIVESFTATANANGQIVVSLSRGSADQPKIAGIEVQNNAAPTIAIAISAGSANPVNSFSADKGFSGGKSASTLTAISLTGVANAAPEAVYQSERFGSFAYTFPQLIPGSAHTVRLHFAEFFWTRAGQRVFNVAVNGTPVLTNFDIIAAAKAPMQAVTETFTATANSSGQIVINFTNGTADQAKVDGIEVQ